MLFKHQLRRYIKTALLFLVPVLNNIASAQTGAFNFHHLTTATGLSNPVVRSIARDKFGYIWLGTINGLNRYNSYSVKIFQHQPADSFSLPENDVSSLFCDASGTLWIGQSKGLYKYDYNTSHFMLQPGSAGFRAIKMLQAGSQQVYIGTSNGLVLFDTKAGSFNYLHNYCNGAAKLLLAKPVNDFCMNNAGNILIATDTGLVVYHPKIRLAERANLKPVKNGAIQRVAADRAGNFWVNYNDNGCMLLKTDAGFSTYHLYNQFKGTESDFTDNQINSMLTDRRGRVWVSTIRQGLGQYSAATDSFIQYKHDPFQSMSIVANFITILFEDKDGFIWTGSEGYGADYFHPDKNLFHSIQQSFNQMPTLPDNWGRAASEDMNGNLWLGTSNGVAKYDPVKNKYSIFQNTGGNISVLQANSIRAILCDGDDVWIGANGGLNRYHISTGKMDFVGEKDSIPHTFFWSIAKDHEGNVWFGTRDGLYQYNYKTKKTGNLKNNALLAPYCKKNAASLFEDSHNRLWIGFYSDGLLMYDGANKRVKHFSNNGINSNLPGGGTITSITEDRLGIIWIATISGLNSYNPLTGRFKHYLNPDVNISEVISSLLCDNKNRLWMASSKGLYVLDTARKVFKSFDIGDGLPTLDFNNQAALRLRNGNFLYPSLKGFVLFNPDNYAEQNDSINIYLSSFKIFGKEFPVSSGIEQMQDIKLNHDQNFFSFEMTALNYANSSENWYAYKLEPFDKDWVYSKDRLVNYTNVPGGNYTLRFKTSTSIKNWQVAEKSIHIYLATVFYKTWWFRLFSLLLLLGCIYILYEFRITQKEKLLSLQSKAWSLEKEKALVMYESLKQQLNPHFLFNSLTSLSSLITANPANAKLFLERMSKIYRYILKSRDTETVPLADEINLAETYTQLQQTRFKNGLQLNIDVGEEYLFRKIAPVSLQNLVENAIKHNIIDAASPLVIHIFTQDDWLVIQNNLQRKNFIEGSNKQGLVNMQSLYRYLSGRQMIIQEDANHFTVKIPLL